MDKIRVTSLVLAGFLHFAPVTARLVAVQSANSASPVVILLKWLARGLAVAGAYHTVSAATGLVSASSISGKVGTRLTYQVKITGREVGIPGSWRINGQLINASGSTTVGLPPGLSFAMKTMIISGTPTAGGTTAMAMTAYEHSNGGGGAMSFTLTFDVASSSSPPVISLQPVGGEVQEGGSYQFSVTATGTPAPSYLWKKDGVAIPGASNPTLALNPVKITDSGSYSVDVSNSAGTITSDSAVLKVRALVVATSITSQPKSIPLHEGESAKLNLTATGSEPLTYQWSKNGTLLKGETNAVLQFASASQADAGSYSVTVSGPGGTITSDSALIKLVALKMSATVSPGGKISLLFDVIPGHHYKVESSDSLENPNWKLVSDITPSGDTATVTDTPSGIRFWRCRTITP